MPGPIPSPRVAGWSDEQVTAVEVHDEAEVLDPVRVEEDIAALRTYAPVRVVVWTRDGGPSDNINAETLAWARDLPDEELLSPDGRYWADGTLVITLSVENTTGTGSGQVGTYFGEDIAVELHERSGGSPSHGYDHFQALNWGSRTSPRSRTQPPVRWRVLHGPASASHSGSPSALRCWPQRTSWESGR